MRICAKCLDIISRSWRVLEDQKIGKIFRIFKSPLSEVLQAAELHILRLGC